MRAGADISTEQSGAGVSLSLPLYAGGLAVTLCGVQAVASSMAANEITVVATLLTLLGFGFSLACRRLRVQPRVIEIACLALIVAFIYLWVSQQLNVNWFMHGADKTEDRLAAGLMWLAVAWSWTLISDDNIMFSCVLTAAMIGLTGTSNVNTPIIVFFCLFVLAMMFLLIHHNYLQSRTLAAPRERANVPRLLLGAQSLLALLCAAAVLGLAAFVVIPAQAIFANLSLAQAVRQLVSAGHAGEAANNQVATQFSDDVDLDVGHGASWPIGTDTVMHVTPSDGQPHYWRGRTYDLYVGTGWQSTEVHAVPLDWTEADERGRVYPLVTEVGDGKSSLTIAGEGGADTLRAVLPAAPDDTPLAPSHSLLSATFEVRGDTEQFYYTDEPRSLLFDPGGGDAPRLSADGRIDLADRPVRMSYSMLCDPAPDVNNFAVQKRLRAAGTDYPLVVRRLYLRSLSGPGNPVTTSDDMLFFQSLLHDIFAPLPPARRTPLDKALAIQNWVATNCTYSLSVPALPDNTDHVRAFLDTTRRGYCDLFASSVVVLCRTAGIPARVATGFAPGEQDGQGFNLRAMDKHAWAEVYFPGARWIVLDATVGSHSDSSVPTGQVGQHGPLHMFWHSLTQSGPVPLTLLCCIAVLLVWVGKNEMWDKYVTPRRRKWAAADPAGLHARAGSGERWGQMTLLLGRLGLPRRPSETPAEYAARARAFLREKETATGISLPVAAVEALTQQFTLSHYGGNVTPTDLPAADRALSDLTNAVRRARRVLLWRRFQRAFSTG